MDKRLVGHWVSAFLEHSVVFFFCLSTDFCTGSMLYEINTLPWEFSEKKYHKMVSLALWNGDIEDLSTICALLLGCLLLAISVAGLFVTSYRFLFLRKCTKKAVDSISSVLSDQEPLIGARKHRNGGYGASH